MRDADFLRSAQPVRRANRARFRPRALSGAIVLAFVSAPVALAQTAMETPMVQSDDGTVDRGAAAPESVIITLSSQVTEIRQTLMEGGEVNADGLAATERAREIATQARETISILDGGTQDTQVTTTRRSDIRIAQKAVVFMEERLDERIAAIRSGDEAEANRARLDVIQAINELPDSIRFEGDVASGDSPTADPGGAQPVLQQ